MRSNVPLHRRKLAIAIVAAAALMIDLRTKAQTPAETLVVSAVDTPEGSRLSIPVGADGFEVSVAGDRMLDISILSGSRSVDLRQLNLGRAAGRIVSAREVISDAGTQFRLILNCDCAARSRLANGVLTIDIAPSFPSKTARMPTLIEPAPGGTNFAPRWSPEPLPRGGASEGDLSDDSGIGSNSAAAIGENDVALARESLLRQLTRAADQGLLTFQSEDVRSDRPLTPPDVGTRLKKTAGPATQDADSGKPAQATAEDQNLVPPSPEFAPSALPAREADIRTRTALDAAFAQDRSDILAPPEPCPSPKLVALPKVVGHGRFFETTAHLRKEIVDDYGHVRRDGVEALARHYISHGFGAESLIVLSTLDIAEADAPSSLQALLDMARIVDGYSPAPTGPFARWAVCGGPFRLWAEAGGLMRGEWALQQPYRDDLVSALDDASPSLRKLLGAAILRSRLNQGDIATAHRLEDILQRTAGINAPGFALQRARLEIALGGSAESALIQLIERDTPDSAFALLALASTYGTGRPPPPDFALRLSDAAHNARGGPHEQLLVAADIRISALSLGVSTALGKTQKALEEDRLPRALLLDAGQAAIEAAGPFTGEGDRAQNAADYARSIIEYAPHLSKGRDGDAARAQAVKALTEIGLPHLAIGFADDAEGDIRPALRTAATLAREAAGVSTPEGKRRAAPREPPESGNRGRSEPIGGGVATFPERSASAETPVSGGELENARGLLNSASDTRMKIREALAADG